MLDCPLAHVLEPQALRVLGALITHSADQPCTARAGKRKDAKQVRLVEIDVQLAIERCAAAFDIGNVEDVPVRPSRKAATERLTHQRARAIATREIKGLAVVRVPISRAQLRAHAPAAVGESGELGAPLDRHTQALQAGDEQLLVLVLRIDLEEGIRRQLLANAREGDPRGPLATRPQVDRGHLVAPLDDLGGEIELAVQLESACLHRKCTRGGARRGAPVDDAHADSHLRKPQSQHQPGRASAGDENLRRCHAGVRGYGSDGLYAADVNRQEFLSRADGDVAAHFTVPIARTDHRVAPGFELDVASSEGAEAADTLDRHLGAVIRD